MADLRNDIEKYLHGELSPEERHALEKRALSDPFLADALEGGESLPADSFTGDLRMLEASLQARTGKKEKKVVPLWVWPARIAAGLLLLAVTTFVINNLLRQDAAPPGLAENKNEKAAPAPSEKPAVAEDSARPVVKDTPKQPQQIEEKKKGDGLLSLAEPEEAKPSAPSADKTVPESLSSGATRPAEPQQQAPVAAAGEGARDDVSEINLKEESQKQVAPSGPVEVLPSPALKKDEAKEKAGLADERSKRTADVARRFAEPSQTMTDSSVAANKAPGNSGRIVRGQVTSADDGKGLPGVNVIIIGTNEGTVTNAEGYYQITVNDDEAGLLFSFIGMENQEVTPDTEEVNVALNADMTQLSEVVVVGYGSEKVSEDVPETFEFAAPKGGRAAYKQYLEKNLRYPELALENNVEGRVTIQFTVETTGELSNFKVLKGIGFGCDEEVIRLIRRGPKWAPTKRDEVAIRDKVKVRVRFRAPKK
jgi:TonB family protein